MLGTKRRSILPAEFAMSRRLWKTENFDHFSFDLGEHMSSQTLNRSFMLPVLVASSKGEVRIGWVVDELANHLGLSQEERGTPPG